MVTHPSNPTTSVVGSSNGSIAYTNFGYIDKVKPGIIGELNDIDHDIACNTFLDDIVGAIAAAAASKLAHHNA